jgi:catechol-2,3-dioxygenase
VEILKLEILTNDLENTERFYQDILDLLIVKRGDNGVSFSAGSTTLTFKHITNQKPVYHFAFNIPHNKLDEAFEWVSKRAEIMDVTPGHKIADFVNWNAKSFYFYDNNGNILEFIARYELENKSDELFDGNSIINISEIGVATDDVTTECDTLINKHNLSVFSKQPRLNNFTAMGDHNGLLILSIASRHWYPTEKLAQKHYTKLEVGNNRQIQVLEFHSNG